MDDYSRLHEEDDDDEGPPSPSYLSPTATPTGRSPKHPFKNSNSKIALALRQTREWLSKEHNMQLSENEMTNTRLTIAFVVVAGDYLKKRKATTPDKRSLAVEAMLQTKLSVPREDTANIPSMPDAVLRLLQLAKAEQALVALVAWCFPEKEVKWG